MFEVEAGDFIACPADGEAHDPRNTGSSPMACIVVGKRLDFDVVDYPEQNKRLDRCVVKPWIFAILPLSDTRFYQMRVGNA